MVSSFPRLRGMMILYQHVTYSAYALLDVNTIHLPIHRKRFHLKSFDDIGSLFLSLALSVRVIRVSTASLLRQTSLRD